MTSTNTGPVPGSKGPDPNVTERKARRFGKANALAMVVGVSAVAALIAFGRCGSKPEPESPMPVASASASSSCAPKAPVVRGDTICEESEKNPFSPAFDVKCGEPLKCIEPPNNAGKLKICLTQSVCDNAAINADVPLPAIVLDQSKEASVSKGLQIVYKKDICAAPESAPSAAKVVRAKPVETDTPPVDTTPPPPPPKPEITNCGMNGRTAINGRMSGLTKETVGNQSGTVSCSYPVRAGVVTGSSCSMNGKPIPFSLNGVVVGDATLNCNGSTAKDL